MSANAIGPAVTGFRWFLDFDGRVSTQYGCRSGDPEADRTSYWLLLDPMLRVVQRAELADGARIFETLERLLAAQIRSPPPVLSIPGVFEPELCRDLIGYFERMDPVSSGVMEDNAGVTTQRSNAAFKVRHDVTITDPALLQLLSERLSRRLCPMLKRAFQFAPRYAERWLLARYDAEQMAHFNAHRDNTTVGTAHRKFACTVNLNPGEYEGGELRFPEFGDWTSPSRPGDSVTFSCFLMHEVTPVTRGSRYAFLTFFYDEDGAQTLRASQSRGAS